MEIWEEIELNAACENIEVRSVHPEGIEVIVDCELEEFGEIKGKSTHCKAVFVSGNACVIKVKRKREMEASDFSKQAQSL